MRTGIQGKHREREHGAFVITFATYGAPLDNGSMRQLHYAEEDRGNTGMNDSGGAHEMRINRRGTVSVYVLQSQGTETREFATPAFGEFRRMTPEDVMELVNVTKAHAGN